MGKREAELGLEELADVRAADVLGLLDLDNTENLHSTKLSAVACTARLVTRMFMVGTYVDRPETGTVTSSHVLVERLDSIRTAKLTELLVHVVGTAARVVADPDAEVLDLQRLLLMNLEWHVQMTAISPYSTCHLNGCKGI